MRISLVTVLLFGAGVTTATDTACETGQLGQLVALLESYAPAVSYCAGLVPSRMPTTTTTITQCEPEATQQAKRDNVELDDYNPYDSQSKAFTKLRRSKQASYDVCTCMNAPISRTVYTTATCSLNEYCTSSGLCAPKRNCKKPARCESDSYCLEAPVAGACFCHPDTDDSTMGYCMSAGPGCPETYEDCSSNAECGGGSRVCIFACCRKQPFCVDLNAYDPYTPNNVSPKRLFRRAAIYDRSSVHLNPR